MVAFLVGTAAQWFHTPEKWESIKAVAAPESCSYKKFHWRKPERGKCGYGLVAFNFPYIFDVADLKIVAPDIAASFLTRKGRQSRLLLSHILDARHTSHVRQPKSDRSTSSSLQFDRLRVFAEEGQQPVLIESGLDVGNSFRRSPSPYSSSRSSGSARRRRSSNHKLFDTVRTMIEGIKRDEPIYTFVAIYP